MENLQPASVNLIYVDPPFFSQKNIALALAITKHLSFPIHGMTLMSTSVLCQAASGLAGGF
jgi:16S rRNA G966 N2-methylase RsmD